MDIICPNCEAVNRSTSRFCAKCGQALPELSGAQKSGTNDVSLPWLQGVQNRAVQKTGELSPATVDEIERRAAAQAQPDQNEEAGTGTPPPADKSGGASAEVPQPPEAPAQQVAQEVAQEAGSPADEAPPDWVVSILEPESTPPKPTNDYEPEEMQHIMPWLTGAPQAGAGESGSAATMEPGTTPGLPPWLSGMSVQETLQSSESAEPSQVADTADLDIDGLEPFVPPEIDEAAATEKRSVATRKPNFGQSKNTGAHERAPAWLKSIGGAGPRVEEETPRAPTEPQPVFPTGGLEPTGTLMEPVVREIPVRPPRAGSVEALAALLQSPAGEAALRPVPGLEREPVAQIERGAGLRKWLLPDGLIYAAMIAVLLAVLLVRPPFGSQNAPAAADVVPFYNAIEALPTGKPVLLVFDWDASRSGEMGTLAEAITRHLMSRRLPFMTISTVPQGPGFAQQVTQGAAGEYGYMYGRDYVVLGYLPGSEAAIGSLVSNFNDALPLDYVQSSDVAVQGLEKAYGVKSLSDFSMIISMASDEAALRSWIEQAGPRVHVPIMAAVPQALEPLARPYRLISGAGLKAVISGPAGAARYIQEMNNRGRGSSSQSGFFTPGRLDDRLNAQSVAQLLVALVIVLALLGMGTRRIMRR